MKSATIQRITGGKKGFKRAIKNAFWTYDGENSPSQLILRYCHQFGFTVESHVVADSGTLWEELVHDRCEGGHDSVRPRDYAKVRAAILAADAAAEVRKLANAIPYNVPKNRSYQKARLVAAGYTATGIELPNGGAMEKIMEMAIALDLPHSDITAFMIDNGGWEVFLVPGAKKGANS